MGLVVGLAPAQESNIHAGKARAGQTPGTEEWIVLVRGRTFSILDRFAAIRAEPDRRRRTALIDGLDIDTRRDQLAFATHVQLLGGRVLRHNWVLNACTIEIPSSRLAEVARHGSAGVLWP